jgi:hypothetical protein
LRWREYRLARETGSAIPHTEPEPETYVVQEEDKRARSKATKLPGFIDGAIPTVTAEKRFRVRAYLPEHTNGKKGYSGNTLQRQLLMTAAYAFTDY